MNEFLNLKGNINIIDVRSVEKYNNSHIPNAINIPFQKIVLYPDNYLDKESRYYIYCQRGTTRYKVCQLLIPMGYKVTNVNGGYESWILSQKM